MRVRLLLCQIVLATVLAAPAGAVTAPTARQSAGSQSTGFPGHLECVPYARQLTGIQIRGDAHTWWGQAAGRYARGRLPKVGAVMNFRPHANSQLGHVAAVTRIIDSRNVLVSHANWSPINGRRGQIENDVRVVDVSERNDWSVVRVWYGPNKALGTTHWPLYGFIYNEKPGSVTVATPRITAAKRGTPDVMGDVIRAARQRHGFR